MGIKTTVNEEERKLIIEVDILPFESCIPSESGKSMWVTTEKNWFDVKGAPFLGKLTLIAPATWTGDFTDLTFKEWQNEYGKTVEE